MTDYSFTPIGIAHSPYKEKFGTPRQANLVAAKGTLELYPAYSSPEATRDLNKFSHLWIIFLFHQNNLGDWSPTARPPRLGGNTRVGVFASRSPRRPNRTGLSVVKLLRIEQLSNKTLIHVEGLDLIEGTPIIDIKPYVPGSDAIFEASCGWLPQIESGPEFQITFNEEATLFLKSRCQLKEFITEVLKIDHRPAYYLSNPQEDHKNSFASRLEDVDVRWRVDGDAIIVTHIICS